MAKALSKRELITLSEIVETGRHFPAPRLAAFQAHNFPETSRFGKMMLKLAAYISLFFASVLVIFPEVGEWLIMVLPDFFLLPERLAKALDYV